MSEMVCRNDCVLPTAVVDPADAGADAGADDGVDADPDPVPLSDPVPEMDAGWG